MWFDEAVIYQIYPLGLCGAPAENDGVVTPRILRLLDWVDHIKKTGADTVLLNPVFDSDRHGYDTRNYLSVDPRLGNDGDLAKVCKAFHDAGIRVMLDGVFNHVGRGFRAFKDVQEKKWDSPYKDWFHINFDGSTEYGDGFWYEGWEGHNELVKLNLWNPAVIQHQFDAIRSWVERFDIDGLRLDVAYCLPPEYLKQLRANGKLTPEYEFYNGGILFSNHSDSDDPTGITAANLSVAHKWALGEVRILQSVEPEYIDADGNKHEHTTANDNIAHMITLMNQQMNFLAKGYDDPKTQTDSVSDQPFFKGTFQEMFTNISGTLAHDTEINTALYTNYNLNALNLDNDRSSVSGVDLNEEATSIMQFQKSFAAACQLLTTIDSMLDKLINGTL